MQPAGSKASVDQYEVDQVLPTIGAWSRESVQSTVYVMAYANYRVFIHHEFESII